jgi:hypothetical protein
MFLTKLVSKMPHPNSQFMMLADVKLHLFGCTS